MDASAFAGEVKRMAWREIDPFPHEQRPKLLGTSTLPCGGRVDAYVKVASNHTRIEVYDDRGRFVHAYLKFKDGATLGPVYHQMLEFDGCEKVHNPEIAEWLLKVSWVTHARHRAVGTVADRSVTFTLDAASAHGSDTTRLAVAISQHACAPDTS